MLSKYAHVRFQTFQMVIQVATLQFLTDLSHSPPDEVYVSDSDIAETKNWIFMSLCAINSFKETMHPELLRLYRTFRHRRWGKRYRLLGLKSEEFMKWETREQAWPVRLLDPSTKHVDVPKFPQTRQNKYNLPPSQNVICYRPNNAHDLVIFGMSRMSKTVRTNWNVHNRHLT